MSQIGNIVIEDIITAGIIIPVRVVSNVIIAT
jgi:hypothetical protein